MSCLMALSSAPRSITRLWILISHFSYVFVPWPHGDFLVTTFSVFTGNGVGPFTLTPVFSPMPLISVQTPSSLKRDVLVNLIRAVWVIQVPLFCVFLSDLFYNACCNCCTHVSESKSTHLWEFTKCLDAQWSYWLDSNDCRISCL